jgi:hypothetical protein
MNLGQRDKPPGTVERCLDSGPGQENRCTAPEDRVYRENAVLPEILYKVQEVFDRPKWRGYWTWYNHSFSMTKEFLERIWLRQSRAARLRPMCGFSEKAGHPSF